MRPLLLRLLPSRLRFSAWARLYRSGGRRDGSLYEAAPLAFAPQVAMELVPGDLVSDAIAYTGLHEPPLSRRLVSLARRGGTLVDVGANLGYYALLWAACRHGNQCLAVEPSERNVELLRRNVARNGFEDRIAVVAAAAGREAGTMAFHPGPADQTGWGGLAAAPGAGTVQVEVVRLDEIARHFPTIELLKVDTEGADAWVLMGAERLLRERRVREIWFEQNRPRMRLLGIAADEAERLLRTFGYEARPFGGSGGDVVQWVATAPR